jgi:biopolymer transport protein TolR
MNEVGQLYLDDVPVSSAELEVALLEISSTVSESTVFVRADEALPYGKVMELIRLLHAAEISRMALVTEADSL